MATTFIYYLIPISVLKTIDQYMAFVSNDHVRWINFDHQVHRINAPAYIIYNTNGNMIVEKWYQHGSIHRENGPSCSRYNDQGCIQFQTWVKNNKLYRFNGPVYITYDDNGNIISEQWSDD